MSRAGANDRSCRFRAFAPRMPRACPSCGRQASSSSSELGNLQPAPPEYRIPRKRGITELVSTSHRNRGQGSSRRTFTHSQPRLLSLVHRSTKDTQNTETMASGYDRALSGEFSLPRTSKLLKFWSKLELIHVFSFQPGRTCVPS